jgi:hypothetical protein
LLLRLIKNDGVAPRANARGLFYDKTGIIGGDNRIEFIAER